MGEKLNRRTLLALSATVSLGGCSSIMLIVVFQMKAEATERFEEALGDFTRVYGYRRLANENSSVLGEYVFEGWRTRFWIARDERGDFAAAFVHRTDLLGILAPRADLSTITDDFERAIAQVEGVHIRETIR